MIQRVSKSFWVLGLFLLSACSSSSPRNPEVTVSSRGPDSVNLVHFIYFGDDNDPQSLNYDNVKSGIDKLLIILKKECGIDFKYSLDKRDGLTFSKNIEFPLEEKTSRTPDGNIPFIYDQFDLYQEFRSKKLVKAKNEIFIIKTPQLGLISNSGVPKGVCGYANPDIQFRPEVPVKVKANIKNTILFNSDQKNCHQDFSWVIAHEIAHLLVQDEPPHMITDDLKKFYNPPADNLLVERGGGGQKLSRKYQCPVIQSTLEDLLKTKNL